MTGYRQDAPPSHGSELVKRPVDELGALHRLAYRELSGFIGGIGQFQGAIAGRAFGALGVAGRAFPPLRIGTWPARAGYTAVSQAVISGIRGGTSLAGRAGDAVLSRREAGERRLSTTAAGSAAIAALNGLIGDQLEREQSPLQEPISVRVAGAAIAPEPAAVAEAFPGATSRPVVFLHGLMETEFAWRLGSRKAGQTYGTGLARDIGCTPVYVRYNSGRHVSENGASLAPLLEELFESWPVEISEVALVGHSMGGLVARSACHQASEQGQRWVTRVRHVVSLGSPHMGAPLAQGVHYASAAMAALPETRPLAGFLRRRSGGIRDLRQGSLVDEDWRDLDPDALRAAACQEVPLLDGATHCFVTATVTRSQKHPLGRLVGDTLVLQPSGSGRSRSRRIGFRDEHGLHVGSTHHLALLNHPAVYPRLREWLSRSPAELTQ
jgi:pimeloyl-ACP methyl ester carboxylesterase